MLNILPTIDIGKHQLVGASCQHTCFLSAVCCKCCEKSVSCLKCNVCDRVVRLNLDFGITLNLVHMHAGASGDELCACPRSNKYLLEWHTLKEISQIVKTTRHTMKKLLVDERAAVKRASL